MTNYVQINKDNIVVGVSQLSDKVDYPYMIEIPEYDGNLLGCLYQDGKFIPMLYYAQLDGNSIVTDIFTHPSNRPEPRSLQSMVKVEKDEAYSLIGAKYVDGKFVHINPQQEQLDKIMSILEKLTGDQWLIE